MEEKILPYKHYIEGERIYLREVRLSDVNDNYCQWLNDSEVTKYLDVRHRSHSLEEIKRFVKSMQQVGNYVFSAICLKENDRHIGNIKLGPIIQTQPRATLSFFIGEKDCWRKGYTAEAINTMIKYAFKTIGLARIEAGFYKINDGAAKVFKKTGFVEDAELEDAVLFNGKLIPAVCVGLTKKNWLAQK